jgi:hypothetical protein
MECRYNYWYGLAIFLNIPAGRGHILVFQSGYYLPLSSIVPASMGEVETAECATCV